METMVARVRKHEIVIDKNTTLTEDLVCNTLTLVGSASIHNPEGFAIDTFLIKHLPAGVIVSDVAET